MALSRRRSRQPQHVLRAIAQLPGVGMTKGIVRCLAGLMRDPALNLACRRRSPLHPNRRFGHRQAARDRWPIFASPTHRFAPDGNGGIRHSIPDNRQRAARHATRLPTTDDATSVRWRVARQSCACCRPLGFAPVLTRAACEHGVADAHTADLCALRPRPPRPEAAASRNHPERGAGVTRLAST